MPTQHHPQPDSATCSASSARLAEPLAGTGPVARAWLAIEQPGPWGRQALTESHFDPDLGRELDRRAGAAGVRIALIRRPGRHALAQTSAGAQADADPDESAAVTGPGDSRPRQVFLANTIPGRTSLRSMTVTDPAQLLDLDFAELVAGECTAGTPRSHPVLLVCTNAKRDQCCALLGRALALDLAEAMELTHAMEPTQAMELTQPATETGPPTGGLDLWESDHLGGHRFAPTAVVLPSGYTYGRLDAASGIAAMDAAQSGQMTTNLCRGRSTWGRPGQAAELALRDELQEFAQDAVLVTAERRTNADLWEVELEVRGAGYLATVSEREAREPRAESCGKQFGTPLELRVLNVEKLNQPIG